MASESIRSHVRSLQADVAEIVVENQHDHQAEPEHRQALLFSKVAQVANLLLRSPDYSTALPDIARLLGEAVGSDRCVLGQSIPEATTGQPTITIHTAWCRAGIASFVEHAPAQLADCITDVRLQPRLVCGEMMSFVVDELAEPMRSRLLAQGNVAMLILPIVVQDELWGLFEFDFCHETRLLDGVDQSAVAIAADSIAAAIERDLTQQKREQAVRQQAAELAEPHLLARDRILEATAMVANTLLTREYLDEAVNTALQIIGESLDTDRVTIVEIEPFNETSNLSLVGWQCLYEWHSSHTVSQLQHPDFSGGSFIGLEPLLERLAKGETTRYLLEELPEPFRSGQAVLGVKNLYVVPIFVASQFWGIFGIDDCRIAKHRDPAELAVLRTTAACIGSAIQRDRTQTAILQAEQARSQELERFNRKLQDTLERLAETEERYRTLFEISSEGIYRFEFKQPIPLAVSIDEQVELIYQHYSVSECNQTFAEMYGYETPKAVAGSGLKDTHVLDSAKNRRFMQAIVENRYQIQNYESEERDCQGNLRYFLNNIATVIQDGYAIGGWASQLDITERRLAQEALADERIQAETALIRERTQIAQDIHDTLAQHFGGILMQLQAATYFAKSNPDKATTHLVTAKDLAKEGVAEARKSVWALYEESREYQDLVATMTHVGQQLMARTDLEVKVMVKGEPYLLDPDIGLNLLRIVQEAGANVVRHAQASTLTLCLTYAPQQVDLLIYDDGVGFDPSLPIRGFGLSGMQQRCDRLGIDFKLTSQSGTGTTIQVSYALTTPSPPE